MQKSYRRNTAMLQYYTKQPRDNYYTQAAGFAVSDDWPA